MKNTVWFLNRLKAMSMGEIMWRFSQKSLQIIEKKRFYRKNLPIIHVWNPWELRNKKLDSECVPLNWSCGKYELFDDLNLFEKFSYQQFKSKWNAGFQTENQWSEDVYSYEISCNQRTDIGDVRTNWELNRHFQFAGLAKNYFLTGDYKYLTELKRLFYDWNSHNLFLHGVQWKSAMEIAIRINSWIFTYLFITKAVERYDNKQEEFLHDIECGIKAMAKYVLSHRSRYSSANNHLIVEMYAVAICGIVFKYKPWIDKTVKILTRELTRQNYIDGVNKEMSLHYQCLVLEAYGLLQIVMSENGIEIPAIWGKYLEPMTEFVADSWVKKSVAMEFGDNDEGKILDLSGKEQDYYKYVLELMSFVLEKKYATLESPCENLLWLLQEETLCECRKKEIYVSPQFKCYKKGGYTFIRDNDNDVMIGIDHAELGFGKLAAHGHADALSFQAYFDGTSVFADAGTFNYHYGPKERNIYRSTQMHNTVSIDNKNQSEILGPFLWGKRAKVHVKKYPTEQKIELIACHNGYKEVECTRKFFYGKDAVLIIKDIINSKKRVDVSIGFLLGDTLKVVSNKEAQIVLENDKIQVRIQIIGDANLKIRDVYYSKKYNHQILTKQICLEYKKCNNFINIVRIQFIKK